MISFPSWSAPVPSVHDCPAIPLGRLPEAVGYRHSGGDDNKTVLQQGAQGYARGIIEGEAGDDKTALLPV